MKIRWDEAKRQSNLHKHGIDFVQAAKIFDEELTVTFEDDRLGYDEERFLTIGFVNGLLITVVYTYRKNHIRLISARQATKYEQYLFHSA